MWNLKNSNNESISPLIYSNNKSQEDISQEIIEMFKSYDVISVKGGVGSGKSAIALRLISYYSSGIIVVPTKVLERQYVNDYYTGSKYYFDYNNQRLPVNFMFGRSNFQCKFSGNTTCADPDMPCTQKLSYDESRVNVASRCQHWSPIYSKSYSDKIAEYLPNHLPYNYLSITDEKTFFYSPEPCNYYTQFSCYTRPGAIIMNLAKWEAETWIGRKPLTPIEIIDEGDMLLDNLSYKKTINPYLFSQLRKEQTIDTEIIKDLESSYIECIKANKNYEGPLNPSITEYLERFVKEFEEESGLIANTLTKIQLILQYREMAYVKVEDTDLTMFLSRSDIVFGELKKRSGKILLMSATMQSPTIFASVFKLPNIPQIEAEPKFPGTLHMMCTSESLSVQYKDWMNTETQQRYYKLFDKILSLATRPTLVQVHAIKYIPPKYKHLLNKGFIDNISWSTVTDRGVDYTDDKCRSVIITKFPLPNISDIVFRVLQRTLGDCIFWQYLRDIANRDLIQQCGRAVRHKNDWCEIWSPDEQVIPTIRALWKGNKIIKKVNSAGEIQCVDRTI